MKDIGNKIKMLGITLAITALIMSFATVNVAAEDGLAGSWNDMVAYGTAGAIIFLIAGIFVYMLWGKQGTNKGMAQAIAAVCVIVAIAIFAGVTISEASDPGTITPSTGPAVWDTILNSENTTFGTITDGDSVMIKIAYNSTSNAIAVFNNSFVLNFSIMRTDSLAAFYYTSLAVTNIDEVQDPTTKINHPIIAQTTTTPLLNNAIWTNAAAVTSRDSVRVPAAETTAETVTLTVTISDSCMEAMALGAIAEFNVVAPDNTWTVGVMLDSEYA